MESCELNAIDIFTRNRHADYPEVVFSSLLSNIIDPRTPVVFGSEILRDILATCGFSDYDRLSQIKVEAEKPLPEAGSIDIFVSSSRLLVGIEIKIWDRSARNTNVEGISQLRRYAKALAQKAGNNKNWILIYVIPTLESRICLTEFEQVFNDYPNNLRLIPWNNTTSILQDENKYPDNSILEILKNQEPNIIRDPISRWIYDSLIERIPDLIEEIPDPGRFPTKEELFKTPDLGCLFRQLFKHSKRYPSSIHTTVGVPYGKGIDRTTINGNSLYGIRTTKAYYQTKDEKDKNIPSDYVEIEIFYPLYLQKENELNDLAIQFGLDPIRLGKHLNQTKTPDVAIISIKPNGFKIETFLDEFEETLRNAVKEIEKNSV
ncbi:MAG: PD-(D/E)XK nuclease family protein [Desulfobacteraceae bacterium]|nr:PD-(D/E)XK nuclease family protein [Desulfobacteraceae bacterium]